MIFATNQIGETTYVSPDWVQVTGQPVVECLKLGWLDVTHPADRDKVRTVLQDAVDAQCAFSVRYRLRMADGRYGWVLAEARPSFDIGGRSFTGFTGSLRTVSDNGPSAIADGSVIGQSQDTDGCSATSPTILDVVGEHLTRAQALLSCGEHQSLLHLIEMGLYLIAQGKKPANGPEAARTRNALN